MQYDPDEVKESLNPHIELAQALSYGANSQIRQILWGMAPQEVAALLESAPPKERQVIWQLANEAESSDVLQHLSDDVRGSIIEQMGTDELARALDDFETDDLADLLQELPITLTRRLLETMDAKRRERLEAVMAYDEDTAGGIMNTDTISVRPDIAMDVVLRYLRRYPALPDTTDALLVVNRTGQYVGSLPLSTIVVSDPNLTVREAMNTDIKPFEVDTPVEKVAQQFERLDLVSAPVVDSDGMLLGRITIDDVVDLIRAQGDHSLMGLAGVYEDEDTFAPILKTARRRAIWLGINLLTALMASAVIKLFEATLEQIVALAVLMPIVASMGGIAGSQTLTLVIRAQALERIHPGNVRWLLNKEFLVGLLNGLLWAAVMGIVAIIWFDSVPIGLVIGLALVANLVVAALSGVSLPIMLRKLKIDPALAGGVVLTTITDIVGFFAFLGLATVFLLAN